MIIEPLLVFFSFLNFLVPDTIDSPSGKFKVSGGVDVYYAYDFTKPLTKDRQYTTQAARHNEFNINWGFVELGYKNEKVRGNFGLHTGTYVTFNYSEEPNELLRFVAQANAGVKLASKVWLDAGIMPSHIGYENTFSADNEIYTRALMAENSPYFSTGVQLTADVSDHLTASLVVLNGWQNITETNDAKSLGINLNYRPTSNMELNYSNYYGNEGNELVGKKTRFFNHTYFKYIFSPKFHSAASFDIGNQEYFWGNERGTWHTGMLLGQYSFTEEFSIAARIEYYHDPDQIIIETQTPNGFQTTSFTLNLAYAPTTNAIIRLEGRSYDSKDRVFHAGASPQKHNYIIVSSLALKFR